MKYNHTRIAQNRRIQSGIPSRLNIHDPEKAQGLFLRGVITTLYLPDDPKHPFAEVTDAPKAMYCDVYTYDQGFSYIRNVLVTNPNGSGMHDGVVWKPRATTIDVSGNDLNQDIGTNPANLDGDHVVVGFLAHDFNKPFIQTYLPHPLTDEGNKDNETGQRQTLKTNDGDYRGIKFKGVGIGITTDGNINVDTTKAYSKPIKADGTEPENEGDGASGNIHFSMAEKTKFSISNEESFYSFALSEQGLEIKIDSGATFLLKGSGNETTLDIGSASDGVALGPALKTYINNSMVSIFNQHFHAVVLPLLPAPVNGVTIPGILPATMPTYDPSITSTKVKVPSG